MPGIACKTWCSMLYPGIGMSNDLDKGLFDWFRSLRIWSLSLYAGLMVGDMLRHTIVGSIILTIGFILGFRPQAGIVGVLASLVLLVDIGFGSEAMSNMSTHPSPDYAGTSSYRLTLISSSC